MRSRGFPYSLRRSPYLLSGRTDTAEKKIKDLIVIVECSRDIG